MLFHETAHSVKENRIPALFTNDPPSNTWHLIVTEEIHVKKTVRQIQVLPRIEKSFASNTYFFLASNYDRFYLVVLLCLPKKLRLEFKTRLSAKGRRWTQWGKSNTGKTPFPALSLCNHDFFSKKSSFIGTSLS